MKWILIVIGAVIALAAVVALVGATLPRGHVARRTGRFSKPPEQVWAAITDFAGQASWRADIKSVERLPDQNGASVWREVSRRGDAVPYATTEITAPRRLVRTIADPKLPYGGRWVYEVAATPDGSALTITEEGEVYNPIFRFVSRFLMGQGGTIEGYLTALSAHFGEPARIERP